MLDWQTIQFILPKAWHPCPSCVGFFLLLCIGEVFHFLICILFTQNLHWLYFFLICIFQHSLYRFFPIQLFFIRCSHKQKPSSTATVVPSIYIELFFFSSSLHNISKNWLSCHLHFYILHAYLTELINGCCAYHIFETNSYLFYSYFTMSFNSRFYFFILVALEGSFDTAEHTCPPWNNLTPGFLKNTTS